MDHYQKIEFDEQVSEIEAVILKMDGPYSATHKIMGMLNTLRETWLEDAVFGKCEGCEDTIFESEMDSATMSEDAGWFCAGCVTSWNEDTAA